MANYEKRRKSDNLREAATMEFLEERLYKGNEKYKRNYDRKTQRLGIDFMLAGDESSEEWNVDLKAAAGFKYAKGLHTGCLECFARYKSGNVWKPYVGWFLNPEEINDSFMYAWIDEKYGDKEDVEDKSDIKTIEVALVRKHKIIEYLVSIGWPLERIESYIKENIVGHEKDYGTQRIDGLKFNCPRWFYDEERPINILVPRNIYIDLSDFHKSWTV